MSCLYDAYMQSLICSRETQRHSGDFTLVLQSNMFLAKGVVHNHVCDEQRRSQFDSGLPRWLASYWKVGPEFCNRRCTDPCTLLACCREHASTQDTITLDKLLHLVLLGKRGTPAAGRHMCAFPQQVVHTVSWQVLAPAVGRSPLFPLISIAVIELV